MCYTEHMITDIDSLGLVPRPFFVEFTAATSSSDGTLSVNSPASEACPLSAAEQPHISLTEDPLGFVSASEPADPALRNEAYVLEIRADGVYITAHSDAGAFYAKQTLRQLVMTASSGAQASESQSVGLPLIRVEDAPAYRWRGFMIDCCRNFYSASFIKKMIDVAALHKLNRFHWHLTDDQGWRLPVRDFPLLTEVSAFRDDHRFTWDPHKGGFYTEEEIADVVSYAAERHITVVPEIETPGHTVAVLSAYPELGCTGGPYAVEDRFGIFDDVLCAGNDGVLTFFEKVFDTVCSLFPGEYVHIGGDECPRTNWKKCPKCQARMKALGLSEEGELQSWLTVQFARMLEKRGKRPVGWDEVLEGTEKLGLPESLIVQSWRGLEGGKKASGLGHDVVMSPQTAGCYLDAKNYDDDLEPGMHRTITTRDSYSFSPVTPEMNEEQAAHILGGQGNLWTELIYAPRIAEYMLYPRLCALSEALWLTEADKDFDSFSRRLGIHKSRLDALDVVYYKGRLS